MAISCDSFIPFGYFVGVFGYLPQIVQDVWSVKQIVDALTMVPREISENRTDALETRRNHRKTERGVHSYEFPETFDQVQIGAEINSFDSTDNLKERIEHYIEHYNLTAKPYKWTYTGVPLAA